MPNQHTYKPLPAAKVDQIRALARQMLPWTEIAAIVDLPHIKVYKVACGTVPAYRTPGALTDEEIEARRAVIYRSRQPEMLSEAAVVKIREMVRAGLSWKIITAEIGTSHETARAAAAGSRPAYQIIPGALTPEEIAAHKALGYQARRANLDKNRRRNGRVRP